MFKSGKVNFFLSSNFNSLFLSFCFLFLCQPSFSHWVGAGWQGPHSCNHGPPPGYDEEEYTFTSAAIERCFEHIELNMADPNNDLTYGGCRVIEYTTNDGQTMCESQMWVDVDCPPGSVPDPSQHNQCTSNTPQNQGPPDCPAGNPINILTGNKYQVATDYIGRGRFPLSYIRRYNSAGEGWSHPYQGLGYSPGFFKSNAKKRANFSVSAISFNKKMRPLNAFIKDDSGNIRHFKKSSSEDIYATTEAANIKLSVTVNAANETESFLFTDQNGDTTRYDLTGRVISKTSRDGIQHTYNYNANTLTITHENGDSLILTFNEKGQVTQLTKPNGQVITYTYDDLGNLLTVLYPGQTTPVTYHYENENFERALTGITNEKGDRYATWSYDAQGRAITSEHAGSVEKVILDHSFANDAQFPRVIKTNELGKQTTYHIIDINGKTRVHQIEGHATANCLAANKNYEYDSEGRLRSVTDWKGVKTDYTRDQAGRELKRIEAYQTENERTYRTVWHEDVNLPLYRVTPNTYTAFQYDSNYRVTSQATYGTNTNSDGDSLPDHWELIHFGHLEQNDSTDFDQDGTSDLQAWIDGLDPTGSNASPQDAYRYYQFAINANDGDANHTSMSEFELLNDGISILLNANVVATHSSAYYGDVSSLLLDENDLSEWVTAAGGATPAWVQFDLGEGNASSIDGYSIQSQRVVTGRTPTAWTLKGSNDGIIWAQITNKVGEANWAILEERTFEIASSAEPTPTPTPVAESGYRHFRLSISANDGDASYTSMSEFELIVDGVDILVAGSVSAIQSSANGSDDAYKLLDNNIQSEWVSTGGQAIPSWVRFDLGEGNAAMIQAYSLQSQRVVTGRTPTSWVLEGSNDGLSWEEIDARQSQEDWAVFEKRTFDITPSSPQVTPTPTPTPTPIPTPVVEESYQHYRFSISANDGDGSYTSMSEFELLVDGVDVLVSANIIATHSSANGSDGADKVMDDNTQTEWVTSGGSAIPSWVQFNLGEGNAVSVDAYSLQSQRVVTGRTPSAWTLEGSNDGTTWTQIDTQSAETGWAVFEKRSYTVD